VAYLVKLSFLPRCRPQYDIDVDAPPRGLPQYAGLKTPDFVPPDHVPRRARIESAHKFIPHVGPLAWYWCVCDRFKALLEEREPGIHQFFPIDIAYKDGRLELRPFYLFHIRRVVSAMIIEKSNVVVRPSVTNSIDAEIRFYPFKITLSRARIRDCHVWRSEDGPYVFFSDDLFAEVKKHKLGNCLIYYHTDDE
jgi:hypothetical protein